MGLGSLLSSALMMWSLAFSKHCCSVMFLTIFLVSRMTALYSSRSPEQLLRYYSAEGLIISFSGRTHYKLF